jgi:hypothetical protein
MSYNADSLNGGNITLNSGAVAAGTNAGSIKTTATVNYTVNGVFKSKAATDNIALPAPSAVAAYTAGAFQVIPIGKKALVTSDDPAPVVPQKSDCAVVAVFTVKPTSAAFTSGTTVLGTGNTVTYYNTMIMPAASLT